MEKLPVSIIMLTLNEEDNLPGAIENIKPWAEEIYIVDSLSTDKTVDIAIENNIKIVQRPFTNFGDQWNWAIDNLPIKTPWTIKLDPDERFSESLVNEMRTMMSEDRKHSGYYLRDRLWFMGKPLHVELQVIRLWKTGLCRFSDVTVNEHPIIKGSVGLLKGFLEHLDSPNLHHWYEKQNRYTTMEAIRKVKGLNLSVKPNFFGSSLERRMFIKKLFFRIPLRYPLFLLYLLFYRKAALDGLQGLTWAKLRVEVRRSIELKIREIETTGSIPKIYKSESGAYDPRVLSSSLQKSIFEKNAIDKNIQ